MSALPAHNTAQSSLPLVIWFSCLAGQVRGSNEIIQNAFGLSLSCCHPWDGFFSVNPVVKDCQSPLQISLPFHNDFKKISTNNKMVRFFVQCWNNVEDVGPTLYKCYTNVCVYLEPIIYHQTPRVITLVDVTTLIIKKMTTCKACGFTSQWK